MTNKTRWTKVLLCAIVIGVVTLTVGGVVSLSAQGAPGTGNPFSAVLAKLDEILAILTAPPGLSVRHAVHTFFERGSQ